MPRCCQSHRACLVLFACGVAVGSAHWPAAAAEPQVAADESTVLPYGAFTFSFVQTLPGAPADVYDALTGDISAWWDHSFVENPWMLYIEAHPGGGFWELFDAGGDGVRHAVVTYARRGERLRMEGPLGLSGHALHMVTTYELAAAAGDSTRLTLRVNAAGEVHEGWAGVVEATWRHFLIERFRPYYLGLPGVNR